ncbi:helix-turn-helix transcriptional regulator [Vagococcus sp. BWB3-3]|uniref:Helix-turn-helix transcriptional regulator n=1 Tax=Vagococcus allomyrinae TaxID=2794353 RepID=A0A940SRW0_9ENTE|nr:helix-turn-helix transcriptional regulator [Vagococcus allomyrinae]MBP1041262.1 helix-turn-helix transcriptional regulator [Vagococcus allomyrinae]
MTVLEVIKRLANEKNVSLAEVERAVGLSNGAITKWAKSSPSSDKLVRIADYFNVSVDYLLGRTDDSTEDKNYFMIQRKAKRMTPEQREKTLRILEATFDDDELWNDD